MEKSFYFVLAGVLGLLVLIFVAAGGKEEAVTNTFEGDPLAVQVDDYVLGEGTSGVTLVEYADFACPGCTVLFSYVDQLKNELGDEIKVVFRHYPLQQLHPNAIAAHRAAEAAAQQGKFWEMHDLLFSRFESWTYARTQLPVSGANDVFEGFASELGLDVEQFKAYSQTEDAFNKISAHIDSGQQLGINATPTLYMNGEEVPSPASYEELKAVVDAKIAELANNQSDQTQEEN